MATSTELFEQHVLSSLEKQKKLSDLVGLSAWNLDMAAMQLAFPQGGFRFPCQLLGSQSEKDGSWLWAWANTHIEAPWGLLQSSRELQELGEELSIDVLTEPQFDAKRADGHYLSLLASGALEASAHYRCAYPGGAAFVLVQDERIDRQQGFTMLNLISMFSNIMGVYSFNHRNALLAYLSARKLEHGSQGDTVRFTLANGEQGEALFDSLGRLSKMSAQVEQAGTSAPPASAPQAKHAPFTQEEWEKLRKVPVYVLLMVGGADRDLDDKEFGAFIDMMEKPGTITDPWLRKIGLDVQAEARTFPLAVLRSEPQIAPLLVEINRILDQRLSPEESKNFKLALLRLGTEIAETSGGFLGFGSKISKEEKKMLDILRTLLGLP